MLGGARRAAAAGHAVGDLLLDQQVGRRDRQHLPLRGTVPHRGSPWPGSGIGGHRRRGHRRGAADADATRQPWRPALGVRAGGSAVPTVRYPHRVRPDGVDGAHRVLVPALPARREVGWRVAGSAAARRVASAGAAGPGRRHPAPALPRVPAAVARADRLRHGQPADDRRRRLPDLPDDPLQLRSSGWSASCSWARCCSGRCGAGSIADAHDRRRVLLVPRWCSAVTSIGLAVNAGLPHPLLWPVFACTAASAAFQGVDMPARKAALPMILATEDLPAALAAPTGAVPARGRGRTGDRRPAHRPHQPVGGLRLRRRLVRRRGHRRADAAVAGAERRRDEAGLRSIAEGMRYLRGQRLLAATFLDRHRRHGLRDAPGVVPGARHRVVPRRGGDGRAAVRGPGRRRAGRRPPHRLGGRRPAPGAGGDLSPWSCGARPSPRSG